jgi:N-acetylmuramoyl-L-alanine amidase
MGKLPVLLTCAFLVFAVGCHHGPVADPAVIPTFQAVTDLLDQLAAAPASVVPDAVLNRARCVVVIPATLSTRTPAGAAGCRDDSGNWKQPALAEYDANQRVPEDILIFILSDRSVRQWQNGKLDLQRVARAGPAVDKVITVTDADLAADALSYVRTGSGLAGKRVPGTIALAQAAAEIASAEPPSARQVVGAVTSFFNTITPIGIILHHSAVIPGDERVPSNAGEVDEFHRARGFDIRCQGREYHVAYHYLVLPDGTVKAGRPERCQGAHAKGYNSYLGIALVGDFSSTDNPRGNKGPQTPTAPQMQAVTALCRKLMQKYNVPLQRVMRHSDVASTRCPGDRFPFSTLLSALQGQP